MPNDFETTIGAFEDRMALRRRMMAVTGVHVSKEMAASMEEITRQSVVRCFECENSDYCRVWLEAVDPGVMPPDFCPNAELNRQLLKEHVADQ